MYEQITSSVSRVGGASWGLDDLDVLSVLGDSNVYLVDYADTQLLIDVATINGQEAIENNLREYGIKPQQLSGIVLTHSHYDHAQGAIGWQSKYGLPVYLNSVGAEFLAKKDYRLVGYMLRGPELSFEPFKVDHPLDDNETAKIGNMEMKVYHMPGHTPDSTLLVFQHDGQTIGFCGDITFFPQPGSRGAIGALARLYLSNLVDYQESLTRFLDIELDFLLPGHGHPLVRDKIHEYISQSLAIIKTLRTNPEARRFGIPI